MASETTTPTDAATDERNAPGNWKAAVVAVAIPALYGLAPPPNPRTAPLTRST